MKNIAFTTILAIALTSTAYANSINIPNSSRASVSGTDSFRTSDGTTCSNAIASNGAMLDVGVAANVNTNTSEGFFSTDDESDKFGNSFTVFARVSKPIGEGRVSRIDCNRLYNMELQRMQAEIEALKAAAESAAAGFGQEEPVAEEEEEVNFDDVPSLFDDEPEAPVEEPQAEAPVEAPIESQEEAPAGPSFLDGLTEAEEVPLQQ